MRPVLARRQARSFHEPRLDGSAMARPGATASPANSLTPRQHERKRNQTVFSARARTWEPRDIRHADAFISISECPGGWKSHRSKPPRLKFQLVSTWDSGPNVQDRPRAG